MKVRVNKSFKLLAIFLLLVFYSKAQTKRIVYADSIAAMVDKDTSLQLIKAVDSVYQFRGDKYQIPGALEIYQDKRTREVVKIKWILDEEFYRNITFYFERGKGIKAIIREKVKQTDINPAYETNAVVYFQNDKVITNNHPDKRATGSAEWYLSQYYNMLSVK